MHQHYPTLFIPKYFLPLGKRQSQHLHYPKKHFRQGNDIWPIIQNEIRFDVHLIQLHHREGDLDTRLRIKLANPRLLVGEQRVVQNIDVPEIELHLVVTIVGCGDREGIGWDIALLRCYPVFHEIGFEEIDGEYNIATALRQPGSSFKPIVYLSAFEAGYTPKTILWDVQTEFSSSCGVSGGGCYSPVNFDNRFRPLY